MFLTGCVNPNGMSFTNLQDPVIRKAQYIDAIKFYLNETVLPILFVENSGTDISNEFRKEIECERLEILTFSGNDYDKNIGKGFGEILIIEHALKNSRFIKTADFIYKITGRYKILNIKSFLNEFQNNKHADLIIDLKYQLTYSDSRFYCCKVSFFENVFLKYKSIINDNMGVFFEHALCKATLEAIIKNYSHSVLKYRPRLSGISGTKNIDEDDIWPVWYVKNIRHQIRYYLMKSM